MKKTLLTLIASFALAVPAGAQVDNYALSLPVGGTVSCGSMTELDGLESYSLQFFLCPSSWTEGGTILQRGEGLKVSLGSEGALVFSVGNTTLSASGLRTGAWQQVTLVVDKGNARVLVDGAEKATGTLAAIPDSEAPFVIGGGYSGRIDEVRVWKAALASDFNYFIYNTLNKWTPQRADLVAYYKMDQNLCPGLVDYCATFGAQTGHHGTLAGGATRVLVSDNTKLPYLTSAAYTYNNRFFDRAVSREQYLLSNEIIILGANSSSDGHVTPMTPNNHGTLSGGASWLESYEGRTGVLSLDGTGYMTATKDCLTPVISSSTGTTTKGYTFETWLYVDEWVEGAFLFRKESADGTKGFSVRLGTEGQVIARCNGNDYVNAGNLKTGEWTHLAITTTATTNDVRQTYLFVFNGAGGRKSYTNSTLSSTTIDYTPQGVDDVAATLGEGFKGKLDETAVWNTLFPASTLKEHMAALPMPGFNKQLDAQTMLSASACYLYDDAGTPGFSSYSQDGWLRIMQSAYDGYRGARFFLSVSKHDDWLTTIASASKRAIFAQDLAALSALYDGVELDLEWAYSTSDYANYGLLAQAIKEALPAGKLFRISCHAVTYNFPKDKMKYVDGFTFQQYGPRNTEHRWANFTNSSAAFASYGYESGKTLLSYSTTTSGPYDAGGSYLNSTIKGIKDLDSTLISLTAEDCQPVLCGGNYYYCEGPMQVYKRAAYAVSHGVKGLFYWDMGNDYPVQSQYNCAKWASYGLNANVEPLVTDVKSPTGITTPAISSPAGSGAPAYDLSGRRVGDGYKGLVIQGGKKILRKSNL